MKTKILTTLGIAALIMTAGQAIAQIPTSYDGRPEKLFGPRQGLNSADMMFIRQAMAANIFEIQSSQIAVQKSSDPYVVEYAKEMITDHQMALEELKTIAANANVTVSGALPSDLEHSIMHLQNQGGDTFNAAFENAQMNGHSGALVIFKDEIANGHDEAVKSYAVKNLATIQLHSHMMQLKQTMMGPNKMQGGKIG